ncbi:ABC transporter substrate-binding protein [Rhodococcoides yunnanense]|uniref:ABC transporter substrate-binding protein n=1 Tax=Rhodococcoides yunnanense TaxID=278209 RepID=UPI001C3F6B23|nr:extracellular solute-binding protein [Rhodococcus yunnanensis]
MSMKSTTRRRMLALTAVAAVSTLALSACSSASDDVVSADTVIEVPGVDAEANSYMNTLYQNAISSGNRDVVIYGPAPSTDAGLHAKFSERFPGITVVPQDAPDAETFTKLQVEVDSGNRIADLYTGGTPSVLQAAQTDGMCQPADIESAAPGVVTLDANDRAILYYSMTYFGIVYNTDMVSEADVPKTWNDLLDPKWKGKLAMGDPTVPGGVRYVFATMNYPEVADTWGKEYFEKLAAQEPNIAQSEPTVPSDVASGRFPIGVGVYSGFYDAQKAKGAPIDMSFPLEDNGNYLAQSGICYMADAPDSDAAQLYVNWLLSADGQQALLAAPGSYAPVLEDSGTVGIPSPEEIGHLPLLNPDNAYNAPFLADLDSIFK